MSGQEENELLKSILNTLTACTFIRTIPSTNSCDWTCPKCGQMYASPRRAFCNCTLNVALMNDFAFASNPKPEESK